MSHAMNRRHGGGGTWVSNQERRVRASVLLTRLTPGDGAWLAHALPLLRRRARAAAGAVRAEDIVLRYRPGKLGVADALDATAVLLEPFAAAGATLESRGDWYISGDEDDEDEDADERPTRLHEDAEEDLLVSARVVVDAMAEDGGAAALYWAAIALHA